MYNPTTNGLAKPTVNRMLTRAELQIRIAEAYKISGAKLAKDKARGKGVHGPKCSELWLL